ncbi:hypothetical protein N9V54_04265 [Planktomarina temperata]|nr:hypothetical protein [Planktomarina temperata]
MRLCKPMLYIYFLLTVIASLSVMSFDNVTLSVSALLCPFLSFWAASGWRGMIFSGSPFLGLALAAILMVPAILFVIYTEYSIKFFSIHISGLIWCVFGFALGFLFTKPSHAKVG